MKGTMRERSPGVWQFRVYVGDDPKTGHPVQVARTWKNLVAGKLQPGGTRRAQTELAKFVTEVEEGLRPSASTLGELLDRWLAHGKPKWTEDTYREYRRKVERDIKPGLGPRRLAKLTSLQLDEWYLAQLTAGRSRTTVHHYHAIIHAALARGVKWGLVIRNVADHTEAPTVNPPDPNVPPLEDVREFLVSIGARNPPVAIAAILGAVTGARRGELCRARRGDVDFERALLTVRGTKTEKSWRIISLDLLALATLQAHFAWQEQLALQARVDLVDDPYIVSTDPEGRNPYRPNSITQAIRRASGGKIHPHALRHFTATVLTAEGIDVRTGAGRLGHADPNTYLRIYAKFLRQRDEAAAEVMGRLVLGPAKAIPQLPINTDPIPSHMGSKGAG